MKIDIRTARLPEALADFEDGEFHAILTDPPFGLGKLGPRRLRAMLSAWLDDREATQTAGMLGRAWDVVVGPATWAELRRVCRPGALVFAYSHARTVHYQTLAMELAGWRILPQFVRIHGGAMALGQDVGKAIDKAAGAEREVIGKVARRPVVGGVARGEATQREDITAPASPLAYRFDGYATATRNLIEPIVSAVNPPDGSWAANAEAHGCGGFNVGGSRIPMSTSDAETLARVSENITGLPQERVTSGKAGPKAPFFNPGGRYPSNVLLEHAEGCGADWCVEGCPVRTLGEMSGHGGGLDNGDKTGTTRGSWQGTGNPLLSDWGAGTAARFYYQGRASREERHRGAEGLPWRRAPNHPDGWKLVDAETWEGLGEHQRMTGNPHLAVKAADGGSHLASLLRQPGKIRARADHIDGMQWRLDSPRLLVPYAGTGSEIIAAMLAGWRDIVAIEASEQWCEVARRRVEWWREKIEAGSRGEALEILRDWGTADGPEPRDDGQLGLFE